MKFTIVTNDELVSKKTSYINGFYGKKTKSRKSTPPPLTNTKIGIMVQDYTSRLLCTFSEF